jgi:hypothetical protein
MIYQTHYGTKSRIISLVVKDIQVDLLKTTEPSSMQYYGSSGLGLPGEIYLQTMETGRRFFRWKVKGICEKFIGNFHKRSRL